MKSNLQLTLLAIALSFTRLQPDRYGDPRQEKPWEPRLQRGLGSDDPLILESELLPMDDAIAAEGILFQPVKKILLAERFEHVQFLIPFPMANLTTFTLINTERTCYTPKSKSKSI